MKKTLSLILAIIMLFSALSSVGVSYAADKKYAEDVLEQIQKKGGFVPGETAAVVGNCYGFISAVCERLYGSKYQEQLNSDGYTCKHKTGLFYTVKKINVGADTSSANIEKIINFFIENAYAGDVVHYASLSSGSTHTFMIQSIDEDKMRIYHSNYQTKTLSSATCHIDTIYWDSFRANPTKTIYNSDGSLYSHNSLFYNKQKNGGLGITINRFTNYEDLFYPAGADAFSPPTLSVTRSSTTSIKMSWSEVRKADKYQVEYKKSSDSSYTVASANCLTTSYNVTGLTTGAKYNFRVRAYVGGKWRDYSNVVTKQVLPPTIASVKFTPASKGLKLTWAAKSDITGVKIYKSDTKDGDYTLIKTLSTTASSYIDTDVKYGQSYFYKLRRYKTVGDSEYSTTSSAFEGRYVLKAPTITYTRDATDSVTFHFNGDSCQDYFEYYFQTTNHILETTTQTQLKLQELTLGESYTIFCRETTKVGSGEYSTLTVTCAPRTVEDIKAAPKIRGILVNYKTQSDVDGYYVYRSAGGAFEQVAKLASKTTSYYADRNVEYNKAYRYLVRAYALDANGNEVLGDAAVPTEGTRVYLTKPTGVKAVRKSPTKLTLQWSGVDNAVKYVVQYKQKGGEWKTLSAVKGTSRTFKKLTTGKKYCFRVKAVNYVGEGSYSKTVTKKVLPPAPAAPTAQSVSYGIRVSYTPQKYASGYYIYKKNSKGKYKLLAKVQGRKQKSYLDERVDNGRRYYYKIACYVIKNGKTYVSEKSDFVSQVN